MVSPTDDPQTTLVADAVPVLEPQTTLNAANELVFQGNELPQTTDVPFRMELPQTTEVPHTTDVPQTTELLATVPFPYTRETVPVSEL